MNVLLTAFKFESCLTTHNWRTALFLFLWRTSEINSDKWSAVNEPLLRFRRDVLICIRWYCSWCVSVSPQLTVQGRHTQFNVIFLEVTQTATVLNCVIMIVAFNTAGTQTSTLTLICPYRFCHLDAPRAGYSRCGQTGILRVSQLWFVCLWWKRAEWSCWDVMRRARCSGCWISLLMWHNRSSEWPCHLSNKYTLYRVCSLFYLRIYSRLWSLVIDMPSVISHPAGTQWENKYWGGLLSSVVL